MAGGGGEAHTRMLRMCVPTGAPGETLTERYITERGRGWRMGLGSQEGRETGGGGVRRRRGEEAAGCTHSSATELSMEKRPGLPQPT